MSSSAFEEHRSQLLALAYRMLGDMSRAEDVVQDAWLRWQGRELGVETPRAYLLRIVTRLCLDELNSPCVRREEARGDRLPEPVDWGGSGLDPVETLDTISMAFLVLLQRLTPAERAVLLLHEVFGFDHTEVSDLLGKSVTACRQLLRRARSHVAAERRALTVSEREHRELLSAFLRAAASGSVEDVTKLLSEDAVLIADAGPAGGTYGRVRNLSHPLVGNRKVAAFVASVTPQGASGLETREATLNGQPAILVLRDGEPYTAILLSIVDRKIRAVYLHADPARLGHVFTRSAGPTH